MAMITLEMEKQPVQWMDGGRHMVGRRLHDGIQFIVVYDGIEDASHYLIRLSQPIADVLVRCDEPTLRPYPDSPIPEPTNTGRKS